MIASATSTAAFVLSVARAAGGSQSEAANPERSTCGRARGGEGQARLDVSVISVSEEPIVSEARKKDKSRKKNTNNCH